MIFFIRWICTLFKIEIIIINNSRCISPSYFCGFFYFLRFYLLIFFSLGFGIKIETLGVSRRNKHIFGGLLSKSFKPPYVSVLKMDLVRTIKHQRNDSRRESSGVEALGNDCSKTALIKPRLAKLFRSYRLRMLYVP